MKKHKGQVKKGTDIPYTEHLFSVAETLKDCNLDEDIIISGLLHDTLEDTEATYEELKLKFNETIANIVLDCSEDKRYKWKERKQKTITKIKEMSADSIFVIMADKIDNLRSIGKSLMEFEEKCIDEVNNGNLSKDELQYKIKNFRETEYWTIFKAPKSEQSWYYKSIYSEILNYHCENEIVKKCLEIMTFEINNVFGE